MKITLKENETVNHAITKALKDAEDKKHPFKGGKVCIFNHLNKCIKVTTITGPTTKVDQAYGENLEINRLIANTDKKNLLKHQVKFEGEYDDIPFPDYQTAMNKVAQANSMYEALPASHRKGFKNAGEFLKFVQDPDNGQKLIKMGIAKGLDGLTATGEQTGHNPIKDKKEAETAAQAAQDAATTV